LLLTLSLIVAVAVISWLLKGRANLFIFELEASFFERSGERGGTETKTKDMERGQM